MVSVRFFLAKRQSRFAVALLSLCGAAQSLQGPAHVLPTLRRTNHHVQAPKTELRALSLILSTTVEAADAFWRTSPYAAAALICGAKASAADFLAQKRQLRKEKIKQEKEVTLVAQEQLAAPTTAVLYKVDDDEDDDEVKPRTDKRRNLAYILYGAIYQGMAQEYIYNHLYPVMFGSSTRMVTVLAKVLFDLLIQTTLLTLPIAYMFKAVIYGYSFREALFERYVNDIRGRGLLTKYFCLWGPVQCLTFSIIPEHLRITFVAMVSFFWLIILSTIASKTPPPGKAEEDGCRLVDGQTCEVE